MKPRYRIIADAREIERITMLGKYRSLPHWFMVGSSMWIVHA